MAYNRTTDRPHRPSIQVFRTIILIGTTTSETMAGVTANVVRARLNSWPVVFHFTHRGKGFPNVGEEVNESSGMSSSVHSIPRVHSRCYGTHRG